MLKKNMANEASTKERGDFISNIMTSSQALEKKRQLTAAF
jgi:hypothetical protein